MTGTKKRIKVITSMRQRRRWSAEEKVAAHVIRPGLRAVAMLAGRVGLHFVRRQGGDG
jgi:hypothetical protein